MITHAKQNVSGGEFVCSKLDAADNVLFSRSLEAELPNLVETRVSPTSVRTLFPVNTAFAPETRTITWRKMDVIGAAKLISDYAEDFPLINMFGERKSTEVRTIGAATKFSIDELQASAAQGNINITANGPRIARDAILRKENVLAYEGSTADNMVGLFSGTPVTGIAQTAAAGTWALATQIVIYNEMAALIGSIHEDSKTVHSANRILMSPANFRIINTTQFSTASDVTTLGFFRANHPGVEVVSVQEFSLAGAKGGMGAANSAVLAYNFNPEEIQLAIPLAIQQLTPFEKHQTIETAYRSRTGGFIIMQPLALKFLTGT